MRAHRANFCSARTHVSSASVLTLEQGCDLGELFVVDIIDELWHDENVVILSDLLILVLADVDDDEPLGVSLQSVEVLHQLPRRIPLLAAASEIRVIVVQLVLDVTLTVQLSQARVDLVRRHVRPQDELVAGQVQTLQEAIHARTLANLPTSRPLKKERERKEGKERDERLLPAVACCTAWCYPSVS